MEITLTIECGKKSTDLGSYLHSFIARPSSPASILEFSTDYRLDRYRIIVPHDRDHEVLDMLRTMVHTRVRPFEELLDSGGVVLTPDPATAVERVSPADPAGVAALAGLEVK